MRATAADFDAVGRFLRERTGVVLGQDKSYLVRSLLTPIAAREGGGSLGGLVERLAAEPAGPLATEVVEALLNNETWFFRDPPVFEALARDILPELERRPGPVRVWSAACSSGQEAYSIAMIAATAFPRLIGRLEIWATDLSEKALARAREGVYSQLEVNRGLPAAMLVRHFDEEAGDWRVKQRLRGLVRFERLDLRGPWDGMPEMDLVFLRNVLLYFEPQTREEVLWKVHRALRPDGFLVLGSAEATFPLEEGFDVARSGKAAFHRARALEMKR